MPPRDSAWDREVGAALTDPREVAVRWSHLKHMGRSPAHYLASLRTTVKPTPVMMIGTLVHCILLGGSYLVWPKERRGKAWEEFRDANKGAEIFTETEVARANSMALAVERHPKAGPIVKGSRHEVPATWTYAGRRCSTGGIDMLGAGDLSELKATSDARPERFTWHAKSMGYLGQLAWYEVAAAALGSPASEFRIIAVEYKPPYDVVVHRIRPDAMEFGRRAVRGLMERLLVCEEANVWPGYCDDEVDLDVDKDVEFTFGDEEAA